MQYYTYKEKSKFYILPMIVIHNDHDQVDLELAWFKFGMFINLWMK